MITNITNNKINNVVGVVSPRTKNVRAAYQPSQSDSVTLSSTAQDFRTVFEALSRTPDVREDRVSEIRSQMENGSYNVTSESIANKILSRF